MRANHPFGSAGRNSANSSTNPVLQKTEKEEDRLYLGINVKRINPDISVDESVARINSDAPANIPLHLRTKSNSFNPATFDNIYHDKAKRTYTRHVAYQPMQNDDPQGFNIYRYDQSDALTVHCARIRASESGDLYVTASSEEGLSKMVNAIEQKHKNTLYFIGYRYNGDRFSSLTPYFLRVSRNEEKKVIAADIVEYSATVPVKEWPAYECVAEERTLYSGKPLTTLRLKEGKETTHDTLINTQLPVPMERVEDRRSKCIPAFFTTQQEYESQRHKLTPASRGQNYEDYLQTLLAVPSLEYRQPRREFIRNAAGGAVVTTGLLGTYLAGLTTQPGPTGDAARELLEEARRALTSPPAHTGSTIPTHIVTTFHPNLIDTYMKKARQGVDIFSDYKNFTKHVPPNEQVIIRLELPADGSSPEPLNSTSYNASNEALAANIVLKNPRPTSIKWGMITRDKPPRETAATFTVKQITGPASAPKSPDDTAYPLYINFNEAQKYFNIAARPMLDACIRNKVALDDAEWDIKGRLGTPEHGTFAPLHAALEAFRNALDTYARSSYWQNRAAQNIPHAAGQTR